MNEDCKDCIYIKNVEGDNMYIGAQSSINFLSSTIFYNYVDFSSATSNIKGLPLQPYWPANPFYLGK